MIDKNPTADRIPPSSLNKVIFSRSEISLADVPDLDRRRNSPRRLFRQQSQSTAARNRQVARQIFAARPPRRPKPPHGSKTARPTPHFCLISSRFMSAIRMSVADRGHAREKDVGCGAKFLRPFDTICWGQEECFSNQGRRLWLSRQSTRQVTVSRPSVNGVTRV